MAEAKTAAEIEDILSSIRRLVTQDRPASAPLHRPKILSRMVVEDLSQPPKAEAPSQPAVLVLTPALRVSPKPAAAPRPEAATWPESAKPAPQPAEPAGRMHLEPPASLDWEAEMGDQAPDLSSLDWSSFTFARRPMAETYAARSRPEPREVPQPEPVVTAPLLVEAEAPVAEMPAAEMAVAEASPVESRAAEIPGAAIPEAEPVEVPSQEEDSIFSEDILRELVRDLIREQLQGDLGERITRNIRKLVKAEIARTLQAKALE